jgi:hypothetical protein
MKDITLVAIEFQWYDLTKYAIERCLEHIDPKEILVISDKDLYPGATYINRTPVSGMPEYNTVMLKEVAPHINTAHSLYIQWDGIANDSTKWTDDFLNYDYIGAVWPWEQEGKNVGNGGFSLRSKRLLDACLDDKIQLTSERNFTAEDTYIGINYREYLETTYGIKYAPTELARQFSFELGEHTPSFGFHGIWNIFNLMKDADMDYFMDKIDYKGWNIYKWHHTLAAVLRRDRGDIFAYMLTQLEANNPELLESVSKWVEHDIQNPTEQLIIR